ncbi:MAG TPA: hypothetical protein PK718_04495 [Candidatus Methanofastidiosa archaeon]|nr:hypothetical protein [Candidatus Methanofastidiosa archaeon]
MKTIKIQWLIAIICILSMTIIAVERYGLLSSDEININAIITNDKTLYIIENDKVISETPYFNITCVTAEWDNGNIVFREMGPDEQVPLTNINEDVLPIIMLDDKTSVLMSSNDYEIVGIFLNYPSSYKTSYEPFPNNQMPYREEYDETSIDMFRMRADIIRMFFDIDTVHRDGAIGPNIIYTLLKVGDDYYELQIDIDMNEVINVSYYFD